MSDALTKSAPDGTHELALKTSFLHIDKWLDTVMPNTARDNPGEKYARWWFEQARWSATKQYLYSDIRDQFKLFCTFQNERYRVTGASSMGDVWLTKNFSSGSGYDGRVEVAMCSQWSNNPGEHLPQGAELEILRSIVELADYDNEITDAPWWVILDPHGSTIGRTPHDIAALFDGPFFSREDAEEYLAAKRHRYHKNPCVFCMSGHPSRKYKGLLHGVRTAASGLTALQKRVSEWAGRVFPQSTQQCRLEHLGRELKELEADPTSGEEMADMGLILLHMAQEAGVDLGVEMRKKHEINQWRKWGQPDAQGVVHHVEETVP